MDDELIKRIRSEFARQGGKARAKALSAKERKTIATKASKAAAAARSERAKSSRGRARSGDAKWIMTNRVCDFTVVSESVLADGSVELVVSFRKKQIRIVQSGKRIAPSIDRKFIFTPEAHSMYLRLHNHLNDSLDALSVHGGKPRTERLPRTTPGLGIFVWQYTKSHIKSLSDLPDTDIVIDGSLMRELFKKGKLRL
jgi:hypothetical protein